MPQAQLFANRETLNSAEASAFGLSKAAVMLDQSREDHGKLAAALDNNMEVWVAIRTLASRDDNLLPEDTKSNLVKLSQFVTQTTMSQGVEMPSEVIDTLININLQISEGLLESQARAA
jgi:flagellar biosynthesis regulator FlaF